MLFINWALSVYRTSVIFELFSQFEMIEKKENVQRTPFIAGNLSCFFFFFSDTGLRDDRSRNESLVEAFSLRRQERCKFTGFRITNYVTVKRQI